MGEWEHSPYFNMVRPGISLFGVSPLGKTHSSLIPVMKIKAPVAIVKNYKKLKGAQVMATDLRASSCLVIAALMAEGKTTINRVYHLDRGYENLEKKLKLCGAMIKRLKS